MTYLGHLNVALTVIGIVMAIYTIHGMPAWRCAEPIIGDSLVLVAFLLILNSHYSADEVGEINVAWHAFHLVVLINILFHIKHYSTRRRR